MKYMVLIGRIFYSLMFIISGAGHFSKLSIEWASGQGVLMPSFLVPAAGIMAIIGGLSIMFGFKTRWGAWILVVFLIPVTFIMHNFWAVQDDAIYYTQLSNFLKNISMLGGALLIAYHGAGPYSVDAQEDPQPFPVK